MRKGLKIGTAFSLSLLLLLSTLLSGCGILGGGGSDHHHTYDTAVWASDETFHWHAATCGHDARIDTASHTDSDDDGICDICRYGEEPSDHEHTFDTAKWVADASAHWHAATCGHSLKGDYAQHSFSDDGQCAVCGYRVSQAVGSEDNYDTYYQIFVYSYCDSNGDNIGDLKGITSKLDYIADLGYTGIWLTPIHPSPSANHKYSVEDYYGVDRAFGTMSDLDELVSEAHSRGIKIILDMVFNHSSNTNAWFRQGLEAFRNGDTSNKYYYYYNFSNTQQNGYRNYNGVWAEAWFDSSMPDLNLDSLELRAELENVMRFWLVDHDVDGFRLDAAKHFYGPSSNPYHSQSASVVKWINETAKSYKPNAYIVAEVWEGANTIRNYYEWSGSDSFFYFPTSTGGEGQVANAVNSAFNGNADGAASTFFNSMSGAITNAAGHIPAPFLDNHDVNRIADGLGRNAEKIKFAYGLLSLYTGTTFSYYGSEIGMIGTRGSEPTDAKRRYAMLWDSTSVPTIKVDGYANDYELSFGGAVQQLKESASILNYYKKCNEARARFPALLRGTPKQISKESGVLVFEKTYNGQTIRVAVNFSGSTQTVGVSGSLQHSVCISGSVSASGGRATLPARSIAIFA